MELPSFLAYAALGAFGGVLIGVAGIGGVILVPALVYLAGHSVSSAIAAAMCAFIVSGLVGTRAYSKAGSIAWPATLWTWLGALPCAFGGALLVSLFPPPFLELAIGLLAAGSGVHVLVARREPGGGRRSLSAPMLGGAGAVTGLLSALTGTGGPLVLVPILLALDAPVVTSLGLAQAIQLPIAAAATGGYVLSGLLDVRLGLVLAAGIALGTWVGAKAAHALPVDVLRRGVAMLLVIVGGAMLLRIAAS